MVLNAAVQMLREAEELKSKILKFKSGTSMLQEQSLWAFQQQLQKVYQKVLVLDLDYALDKKVEQDLWNIGFKQQIEALQAVSKDRKNALRSEGQAMLSWVLQAATGFYLCLLHQICSTFKLDLPFRRRASLLGCVEGWGAGGEAGARVPPPAAAKYICQHCLVHLGDLARYRQQLRVAHTFYRHALLVSVHSGQPYNQLALVAWRRGRRLAAVYWHVRSMLVRAPFPPPPRSHTNLRRTLLAAQRESNELPVLPGITAPDDARAAPVTSQKRLDAHSYVDQLIRATHLIHNLEDLDTANQVVNALNSSLTALVATDSFDSMTLIKMACIIIWLVHWSSEELTALDASAMTPCEAKALHASTALAGGACQALLLHSYSSETQTELAPLKVWLLWLSANPRILSTAAFVSRPQLWPALAHVLNAMADSVDDFQGQQYETLPLPEDEELHGFLPLESSFKGLQFAERAAWAAYGDRVPDHRPCARDDDQLVTDGALLPPELTQSSLANDPELERKVRAHRLVALGATLAETRPELLSATVQDGRSSFSASPLSAEHLSRALAELSLLTAAPAASEPASDPSEDEVQPPPPPPPPVVISEADFREKVREKRVGILKPQGSLERAREERALATNVEEDEKEAEVAEEVNVSKSEDSKKDVGRKPRMNVAMAAIMRKQEESNKQVKFVTPPPTPDSIGEASDASTPVIKDADKPKVIQPKPVKSLANLPIGKKTGGILSLKDKSAGYPHLVNTDPEPKKAEKEEKKEPKTSQMSQNSQQSYAAVKKPEHSPTNWSHAAPGMPAQNTYSEGPRLGFQHKNAYGTQTGVNYNSIHQPQNNQNIRLPVVNPKEIDVRTAALQKQNSRQEMFQEGHKFGNHSYQISGDKKNFLDNLPPRFANQYRYWQTGQDTPFSQDNKFRDDNFKVGSNTLFANTPQPPARPNWTANPPTVQENYQQPLTWRIDNPPPNYNANFTNVQQTPSVQPNFYSPHLTNVASPYQNMTSYNQMQNQGLGQLKPETTPTYMQSAIGQPHVQSLQNLVTSPSFNSTSFGGFAQPVSYDSAMYPQFNKMGFQPQMKGPDKPLGQYQPGKDLMSGMGFGQGVGELQQRSSLGMNYETLNTDATKNMEHIGLGVEAQGNTYSLFSGAPDTGAWPRHQPQQSLWSGPGPSPLERLLEQQKHMKQAPAEPR